MARHHRRANIRFIISNNSRLSSITINSRSANPSGPNQWMISDHRWCLNRAVEIIEIMYGMETVAATILRHHRHRWANVARRQAPNHEPATTTRHSRSTRIRCDTLSITCSRLIRAITTITRWRIRSSLKCVKIQRFPFFCVNRIKMLNNEVE